MNSKFNQSDKQLPLASPNAPSPSTAAKPINGQSIGDSGPITPSLSIASQPQGKSAQQAMPVGTDGAQLQTGKFVPLVSMPVVSVSGEAVQPIPGEPAKAIFFEATPSQPKSAIPPLMLVLPPEIEAAEGYLELISGPATQFGVRPKFRRMFARKALDLLNHVGECWHNPRHEARRQLAIGHAYRLLKQYDLAANAFRKAASFRAFRAGAMAAAGMCEKKMGRLGEAITSLTRALSVNPDIARFHFQLARCLCLAGQNSAALFELGFAIHLDAELTHRAFLCADFDSLRSSAAFRSLIERGVHFV